MNPNSSKPVLVCAFGLLVAFFMPWVAGMSGYNLGQLGSYGNYAWAIPILAGVTILLSFSGINNRGIGVIAGIVSLGVILYDLLRLAGEEVGSRANEGILGLAGQVLLIGAWLTIIFSIVIIIAAIVPVPVGVKQNVGGIDKVFRLIIGLVIIALGILYQSWWGAIGFALLLSAAAGWCPAYLPFGISTCKVTPEEKK